MTINRSLSRFLLVAVPLFAILAQPVPLPQPAGLTTTHAQAPPDPCRTLGGVQTTQGKCVTTSYLLVCDGPEGTPSGGGLFACSSTGCDLGGGGFSVNVVCNAVNPGDFIGPILPVS